MKKLLCLLGICLPVGAVAQVKVGQPVPAATFTTLLNTKEKNVSMAALRGKVVLLEFWATWCGPCIVQMPHLQELQESFGGKLQVINVSSESKEKIEKFLQKRPSSLWFAVDTARKFERLFPFRMIPHTVLIDGKGIVRAITDAAHINKKAISDLIAGKAISLPLKEDPQYVDPHSVVKQYFNVPPQTASQLVIQPAVAGAPSMNDSYGNDPNFQNRRLTLINFPFIVIYRMAHGNMTVLRTTDLRPDQDKKLDAVGYCVDVIVPRGEESTLLPNLEKEMRKRFGINGNLEKQTTDVYLLEVADPEKVKKLIPTVTKGYSMAQRDSFEGKEVTIKTLTDYLENYGVVDLPVVDETGMAGKYDISFSFEPQDKNSIMAALQALGLRLTPSQREIEVLVLR